MNIKDEIKTLPLFFKGTHRLSPEPKGPAKPPSLFGKKGVVGMRVLALLNPFHPVLSSTPLGRSGVKGREGSKGSVRLNPASPWQESPGEFVLNLASVGAMSGGTC